MGKQRRAATTFASRTEQQRTTPHEHDAVATRRVVRRGTHHQAPYTASSRVPGYLSDCIPVVGWQASVCPRRKRRKPAAAHARNGMGILRFVCVLRGGEKHDDVQIFGDGVEAMLDMRGDVYDAPRQHLAVFLAYANLPAPARDVINLIFGVWLLRVCAASGQPVKANTEGRHAQKFEIQPSSLRVGFIKRGKIESVHQVILKKCRLSVCKCPLS